MIKSALGMAIDEIDHEEVKLLDRDDYGKEHFRKHSSAISAPNFSISSRHYGTATGR